MRVPHVSDPIFYWGSVEENFALYNINRGEEMAGGACRRCASAGSRILQSSAYASLSCMSLPASRILQSSGYAVLSCMSLPAAIEARSAEILELSFPVVPPFCACYGFLRIPRCERLPDSRLSQSSGYALAGASRPKRAQHDPRWAHDGP